MSCKWGPHYIVPTEVIKSYSGIVELREYYNEDLLKKELESLGISGSISRVNNPWYFRKKGNNTWIEIGESDNSKNNFAIGWETQNLENGKYEVMGLMHIYCNNGKQRVIAGQNVVEISIEN